MQHSTYRVNYYCRRDTGAMMAADSKRELTSHSGGCHCGAVRFTLAAPPNVVAWDCNCSICSMKRNTHVIVPAARFTLLTPEDALSEYRFGTCVARHLFCKCCGVTAFYRPRSNPDGVAVTVACIDPGTLQSVTTKTYDGVHWEAAYAASAIEGASKME